MGLKRYKRRAYSKRIQGAARKRARTIYANKLSNHEARWAVRERYGL